MVKWELATNKYTVEEVCNIAKEKYIDLVVEDGRLYLVYNNEYTSDNK